MAIRQDGRANPHQLLMTPATQTAIASLRDETINAHRERFGANADSDLWIALQLTHSGRYARPSCTPFLPDDSLARLTRVPHCRFPSGVHVLSDAELDPLVDDFIAAARRAFDCGYQFVDVKACHGYLGHEMLGARSRPANMAVRWRTGRVSCGK